MKPRVWKLDSSVWAQRGYPWSGRPWASWNHRGEISYHEAWERALLAVMSR